MSKVMAGVARRILSRNGSRIDVQMALCSALGLRTFQETRSEAVSG